VNNSETSNQQCPVCEAAALPSPYYTEASWLVRRCSQCTFAWVVDLIDAAEDTAFDWGDDIFQESQKRLPMYRDRLAAIEHHAPEPRTWLDIGCGGGGMLRCVRDAGFAAEGIEPSPAADYISSQLGIAVHKKPLSEVRADLSRAEYGVVSYFHVLEHVLDPRTELLLAGQLLAASGLLVVEVPFFDSFPWKIFGHRHRHFYRAHRSYFNKRSLTALLKRTGFELVRCEAVPYYMTLDWLLMRLRGASGPHRSLVGSGLFQRCLAINTGEYLLAVARKA